MTSVRITVDSPIGDVTVVVEEPTERRAGGIPVGEPAVIARLLSDAREKINRAYNIGVTE